MMERRDRNLLKLVHKGLNTNREIKHLVYGKQRDTQVENFQNEKWADKHSLKQLLWIKLSWIYRFSCSSNEQ